MASPEGFDGQRYGRPESVWQARRRLVVLHTDADAKRGAARDGRITTFECVIDRQEMEWQQTRR